MDNKKDKDCVAGVFVNFSNHSSDKWSEEQLNAAEALVAGKVVDVLFPSVDATKDEDYIERTAVKYVEKICSYVPDVVMCQGEFGLTYMVVKLLKEKNICVVYSCSKRITVEKRIGDETVKISKFKFIKFRKYGMTV